jgi:hypothetical protein
MQHFNELTLADKFELYQSAIAAQAKIEDANLVGREGLEPPTKGL